MAWDPQQYLKFSNERLRPGFDLLTQVGDLPPGPVYELGCGTGVHARAIADRWPDRAVVAIDKSPQMLAEAAASPSRVTWAEADIETWQAPEPAALVFSNATLQWLEGHERLFPRLMRQLAPGGVLAVQMPRNFDAPSHALMRETAANGPWAATLQPQTKAGTGQASLLRLDPVGPPAFYYDLLRPLTLALDLWETEYLHVLAGDDPVLEWVRGSALRPVLDALQPELQRGFERDYAARLRKAYPRRGDGHTLLPFRRLFLVARAA
jgi:trans-aconitate 2-methyltransferase